ncbi:hypothetical protein SELR_01900 [Selenomonas ruminantium subsp. lactilytica TAM6421]|uniref:Copper amine oxidase N-terminal domain-containing protein n=1 Tax=Selenomonas ruminantium subsp. lactilytica (strain NBRC 103574 / TAM6421) TaxID=927704 RepID=I0GMB1_SELRL|nr:hypothetical protein [Selenomonas ruminantium]BAL81898.1 hypothetical protein SELR_01900 [Selenomonas ruminantium subsp. lactilytica TAM6421]
MNVKRKILAVLAAGTLCFPQMAMARHAATSGATTVVHLDKVQPAPAQEEGTQTNLMQRIRGILSASEKEKEKEQEQKTAAVKRPAASLNQNLTRWDMVSRDEGGTLLFSDSPEYVTTNGILYQDSVQGDARVLFYHLNNSDEPKKLAVVLKNEYNGRNDVIITRSGNGTPSSDYLKVGKATQLEYFREEKSQKLSLPPGTARLIQEKMNMTILQPGELTYGVFDFHADHSVLVTVLMLDAYGDPVTAAEELPVLPKDEMRLRGTFKGMDRVMSAKKIYNPAEDGGVYFMLADDKVDKYRTGIDATDGSQVINYGNYGINYRLELPVDAGAVKYYLSPLGGVYAGAMRSFNTARTYTLFPTPGSRTYFGDRTEPESDEVQAKREAGSWYIARNTELASLGQSNGRGETVFEFSPPGASNLPVAIVMLPQK